MKLLKFCALILLFFSASCAKYSAISTKEHQKMLTPVQALAELKTGNERFMKHHERHYNYHKQELKTTEAQYPIASVVSCMDSRAVPEIIFNMGIGDIFDVRIAGEVITPEVLGSLEYGAKVAGSKFILVLGHSHCGAIKGTCDHVNIGNIASLVHDIEPVLNEIDEKGEHSSKNEAYVEKVAHANVLFQIKQIKDKSAILREMIDSGEIGILGAMLDIHTGKVTFFDKPDELHHH
jgi:carbonic anhydrase